jgi:phage terminase small subunit
MPNPHPKKPSRPHFSAAEKAQRARSSILDREVLTFTARQKRFIDEMTSGKSVKEATMLAGYAAPRVGHRLLKTQTIRDELHRRMTKTRELLEMTRERVQQMVLEAYEVAKLQADAASMVRAASEINKMCGYYATVERHVKLDVSATIHQEEIRALPDSELIRMAGRQMHDVIEGEARQIIDATVADMLEEEGEVGDDDDRA